MPLLVLAASFLCFSFALADDDDDDDSSSDDAYDIPTISMPDAGTFADTMRAQDLMNAKSCFASDLTTALSGLASSLDDTGGENLGGSILGSLYAGTCPAVPELKNYSCETFKRSGKFDPSIVKTAQKEVKEVVTALTCQKQQLDMTEAQLTCMEGQWDALKETIKNLRQDFESAVEQVSKEVATLDSGLADVAAIGESAGELLNGGKNGGKGLRQAQAEAKAVIDGMSQQANDFRAKFTANEKQESALNNMVETTKMARAAECLKTKKSSSFICEKDGVESVVTLPEFLECRYYAEKTKEADGRQRQGDQLTDKVKRQASNATSTMISSFNGIVEKLPTQGEVPTSMEAAASFAAQKTKYNDMGDVLEAFDSRLSGTMVVNDAGQSMDLGSLVEDVFTDCYEAADTQVENEKASPESSIAQLQTQVDEAKALVKTEVNTAIKQYGQVWGDMENAMTGGGIGTDGSYEHFRDTGGSCIDSSPDVQLGCVYGYKEKLEGILSGTSAESQHKIVVEGVSSSKDVQCYGVNGCILAMEAVQRNVEKVYKKGEAAKKDYIAAQNSLIRSYVRDMQGGLKADIAALKSQMKSLNNMFPKLGIDGSLATSPIGAMTLTEGPDGILQAPTSDDEFLQLIGQGLPDFGDGEPLQQMKQAISQQSDSKSKSLSTASTTLKSELPGLIDSCSGVETAKAAEELAKSIADWEARNCGYVAKECEGGNDSLEDLEDSMEDIFEDVDSTPGMSESQVAALDTGIYNLCGEGQYEEFQAYGTAKRGLASTEGSYEWCGGSRNASTGVCSETTYKISELEKEVKKFEKYHTDLATYELEKAKCGDDTTKCSDLQAKIDQLKSYTGSNQLSTAESNLAEARAAYEADKKKIEQTASDLGLGEGRAPSATDCKKVSGDIKSRLVNLGSASERAREGSSALKAK